MGFFSSGELPLAAAAAEYRTWGTGADTDTDSWGVGIRGVLEEVCCGRDGRMLMGFEGIVVDLEETEEEEDEEEVVVVVVVVVLVVEEVTEGIEDWFLFLDMVDGIVFDEGFEGDDAAYNNISKKNRGEK